MSVLTATGVPGAEARGFLRPVNVRHDLAAIADLVELCFRDTLDPDGYSYLHNMRAASSASRFFDWALSAAEQADELPISGYVWEVDERIVGNLSLISFRHEKQKLSLIANVAVHPDFRRRGIARQLTATALGYIQRRGTPCAWLHVRDDNPGAIQLYRTLGFEEQTRRTTWRSQPALPPAFSVPGLGVSPRCRSDWALHKQWLEALYPADYSWHLPVDWSAMGIGWQFVLYRLLTFTFPRHWTIRSQDGLLGVVSWMHSDSYTDPLYLAAPSTCPPEALQALLTQMRREIPRHHHLSLNCPAGLSPEAFQAAGFSADQTLIWMKKVFTA